MFNRYRNNPTLDIYFREPLGDLIDATGWRHRGRPVRRLGPNTFECNGRAVIIRYVTQRELGIFERTSFKKIYYVLDDDFFHLASEMTLPQDYRARLHEFAAKLLPRVIDISDAIVSPSELILKQFAAKERELLLPASLFRCSDFSHFDELRQVQAVFPGTRSHLNDLDLIRPALEDSADVRGQPDIDNVSTGEHGAKLFGRHPRIHHRRPQQWHVFRRTMRKLRFHLALVPYADSAFNRARSINKKFMMWQHSVRLASTQTGRRRPKLSRTVESGLLLDDAPEAWTGAVARLLDNPQDTATAGFCKCRQQRALG